MPMQEEIARLEKELAEKNILLSLTRDIVQVKAKQELMNLIKLRFQGLFHFYHCTICIISEDKAHYKAFLLDPDSKMKNHQSYAELITKEWPVNDGIVDVTLASPEPVIFQLAEIVLPAHINIMLQSGIRQMLNCTLVYENEQIGVLTFYSTEDNNFKHTLFPLVNLISSEISLAVVNIIANEAIQKRDRENEMLLAVSHAIASIPDKKLLIHEIKKAMQTCLQFSDIAITHFNPAKEVFKVFLEDCEKTNLHPDFNDIAFSEYPISDGLHDTIMHSPETVLLRVPTLLGKGWVHFEFLHAAGISTIAGIRLIHNNDIIGTMVLLSEHEQAFSVSDQRLIERVSYHLSGSMANTLANQSIQDQQREKEILLSLSADISRIRGKDDLMHIMRHRLKEIFHFNDISIDIFNRDKKTFQVMAAVIIEQRLNHPGFDKIAFAEYPVEDGIHDQLLASDKPELFYIENLLMKNPGKHPGIELIFELGIREIAGARLVNKNETIGFIIILSEERNAFKDTDLNLLQGVSDQLAVAVANILANEDIENRETEKSALLSFSSNLSAVRDKKDLSDIIHYYLRDLVYYDDFIICTVNEEKQIHQAFIYGYEEDRFPHPDHHKIVSAVYPVEDGFFGEALAAEGPLLVNIEELTRQGNAPRYISYDYEYGITHILAVPLREGKKNLGVFCILLRDESLFKEQSLKLLQGLSYQLSIALANILANERIEQQLEEIRNYKEKLEEEKLYLQEEISSGYTYADIIGAGAEMQKVFQMLSQVAFAQSTVLILGETGTGKELIARAIHNSSPRKNKLMVKVNCAALPANLIESELFGHEKGSFTGAIEKRIGKFELANHGTLFLDEIGEMPLDLQVKLLRAVQEREIERVGGKMTIKVDVRIIVATNRDLKKEVDEGRFRNDLFYRLNVFPIDLPPLRNRKEDIPLLATHFMARFAKNTGKKNIRLSSTAMKQLQAYNWPGNIRELEHMIERSVLLAPGSVIKEVNLSSHVKSDIPVRQEEDYARTLEEMERDYILGVLKKCNGKIFGPGGAAEILGLHVSTLNHRIKKLGIQKEQLFFIKNPGS